jgi:hypothetical protein
MSHCEIGMPENTFGGLGRTLRTGVRGMGMFKQLKDMKDMVNAAPGMISQAQEMGEQARQMGAQAQQMAAAQQAAAQAQMQAAMGTAPGAVPSGPDFEPISGVSLEQYVAVSKGIAAFNYDQSKLVDVAAAQGISASDWDTASRGWADRMKANPAVGQRFNALYRAG